MKKSLKVLLVIPITILAYLFGYLSMYYSQLVIIKLLFGGDIDKGFSVFSFPLLCSGGGMVMAVVAGTLFSPLSNLSSLKIFLFILGLMCLLSIVPIFSNGYSIRPIAEIVGLTTGYLIARTVILKEFSDKDI